MGQELSVGRGEWEQSSMIIFTISKGSSDSAVATAVDRWGIIILWCDWVSISVNRFKIHFYFFVYFFGFYFFKLFWFRLSLLTGFTVVLVVVVVLHCN